MASFEPRYPMQKQVYDLSRSWDISYESNLRSSYFSSPIVNPCNIESVGNLYLLQFKEETYPPIICQPFNPC